MMSAPLRQGITLIEVAAAIALGVLTLTLLLEGGRRHSRQVRLATLKKQAIEATDELIASWREAGELPPLSGGGTLGDDQELVWSIRQTDRPIVGVSAIRMVELSVSESGAKTPVCTVDLMTVAPQPMTPRTRGGY